MNTIINIINEHPVVSTIVSLLIVMLLFGAVSLFFALKGEKNADYLTDKEF